MSRQPSVDRLAAAVAIAAAVHAGQVDKAGEPYILHPLAVLGIVDRDMASHPVENPYEREALRCAAVLHDAIEDSPRDQRDRRLQHVYNECGTRCHSAVDRLTRWDGEDYEAYIERVKGDWIARRVKLADLAHNTDPTRVANIATSLLRRYHDAADELRNAA